MARHDEAIAAARRAQEIDPLSPILTVSLGRALWHADRREEALAAARKAFELDPNFSQAWFDLANYD